MNHSRLRAAVVAALATLLATVVLAGPAAGAVASVSTGSQVAEEPTTHRFAVDDPGPDRWRPSNCSTTPTRTSTTPR